ncbi:DUF4878 domain-containing protein [Massilia niastensis]|uniref:DUF4878 domain-containing protein n=1 Tax=Massilia niastensis TaxID=544911 RepID=UPI0003760657|nr:DUF4878 domain-containing protein [Massilia niastensis]
MSRIIFRAFCTIAIAASLSGCGTSPNSTVKDFYANLEKGEITEAKKSLSPQLYNFLGEQKLTAALAEETDRIGKCGGIKSITPELETRGETAVGKTTVEYKGDCKTKVEKTKLVKEDGSWKITGNK